MLKKLNPENGWLAERWHPDQKRRAKAAPFKQYKGDPHDAFWYFDKEMADMTEERYRQERGKKPQHFQRADSRGACRRQHCISGSINICI